MCDGTNGTPDLRGVAVYGADASYPYDTRGGSIPSAGTSGAGGAHGHSIAINSGGSHTHTLSITTVANHTHTVNDGNTGNGGDHNHTGSSGSTTLSQAQMPVHNHVMFGATTTSSASNITGSNPPAAGFNDGGEGNRYLIKNAASGHDRGVTGNRGSGQGHTHSISSSGVHSHTIPERTAQAAGGHTHANSTAASSGSHVHTGTATAVGDHTHSLPAQDRNPWYGLYYVMFIGP